MIKRINFIIDVLFLSNAKISLIHNKLMQFQKLNKSQKFVFKLQSRCLTNNNGYSKGIPLLAWTGP